MVDYLPLSLSLFLSDASQHSDDHPSVGDCIQYVTDDLTNFKDKASKLSDEQQEFINEASKTLLGGSYDKFKKILEDGSTFPHWTTDRDNGKYLNGAKEVEGSNVFDLKRYQYKDKVLWLCQTHQRCYSMLDGVNETVFHEYKPKA
jgi:hypothetical protein